MPNRPKPIVVVGSINVDLVARAQRIPVNGETVSGHDFQIHSGGKGANQAVAIAKLGYPVQMIGHLGEDIFGRQLRNDLELAGVDVAAVSTSPGPSGVAMIVLSAAGENSIVVVAGANALLSSQDLDDNLALISGAGMVLTQLETPLETLEHLAELCLREGVPLVLDPAPASVIPSSLLQKVAWLTPNETEAAYLLRGLPGKQSSREIAEALMSTGPRNVVLKLGARGAHVATAESLHADIRPFPANAVDTTAAGDCFNGAFAVALCRGLNATDSARYAAAAAAIAVTRVGAQPSMPTAAEVEEKLGSSFS